MRPSGLFRRLLAVSALVVLSAGLSPGALAPTPPPPPEEEPGGCPDPTAGKCENTGACPDPLQYPSCTDFTHPIKGEQCVKDTPLNIIVRPPSWFGKVYFSPRYCQIRRIWNEQVGGTGGQCICLGPPDQTENLGAYNGCFSSWDVE